MAKQTYGYKEFIEAFIRKESYKDSAPELRDYHTGLYTHLRDFFGADLDSLVRREDMEPDHHYLDRLFRLTLDCYLGISSPFEGFLEAPRGICDLYEKHGKRLTEIENSYKTACFDLMCEIYEIIFVATDKQITSDELNRLGFDDSEEPDELDFF